MLIGFIGLGTMGRAIAGRLLDEGHDLIVWNRSPTAVESLAARGAHFAVSARDVFSAPIVLSMLADDRAALDVLSDELLESVGSGAVHVNMATVSVDAARRLHDRHRRHGVAYLSAPVLGRATVAAAGKLLVVASGDETAMTVARPVFADLGSATWELGSEPATATLVKIAVNFTLIHALQAIAESVTLVESGGVDASTFIDILTHTAFSGSAYAGYGRLIATRAYDEVGFAMDLGLKDLGLADSAAREKGIELPSIPTLREVFTAALADPALASLDWSAMAEVTRERHAAN